MKKCLNDECSLANIGADTGDNGSNFETFGRYSGIGQNLGFPQIRPDTDDIGVKCDQVAEGAGLLLLVFPGFLSPAQLVADEFFQLFVLYFYLSC